MTEILQNIIKNDTKSEDEKYFKILRSSGFSNDSELRKAMFKEISEFAKNVDNEELIKIYAGLLIEKYFENLINNRFDKMIERIF